MFNRNNNSIKLVHRKTSDRKLCGVFNVKKKKGLIFSAAIRGTEKKQFAVDVNVSMSMGALLNLKKTFLNTIVVLIQYNAY